MPGYTGSRGFVCGRASLAGPQAEVHWELPEGATGGRLPDLSDHRALFIGQDSIGLAC